MVVAFADAMRRFRFAFFASVLARVLARSVEQ